MSFFWCIDYGWGGQVVRTLRTSQPIESLTPHENGDTARREVYLVGSGFPEVTNNGTRGSLENMAAALRGWGELVGDLRPLSRRLAGGL